MSNLDNPVPLREGEELNIDKLKQYLIANSNLSCKTLQISQFPGGYSNLTYLLQVEEDFFVLRRPPFGANIKTAHDMEREFNVLKALKPFYKKIPQPILYCENTEIIGAPFYIMSKAEGVILRGSNFKNFNLYPEVMKSLSENTIINLADLHKIDLISSGLIKMGKPEGYTLRQVEGWTNRYYKSQTDDIKAMNIVGEWIKANVPKNENTAFIHNDYKYDNLVLKPDDLTKIEAVLDWEMATVGNPLMDLGTTLAYWSESTDHDAFKSFNPSFLPGNLNRETLTIKYFESLNEDIQDMLFYYVFGVYKVSVIAQQIYARFKKGFSKDQRFGQLIYLIQILSQMGVSALEKNKITNLS